MQLQWTEVNGINQLEFARFPFWEKNERNLQRSEWSGPLGHDSVTVECQTFPQLSGKSLQTPWKQCHPSFSALLCEDALLMGAVRPRACPSGQRVDAGWIRIPTQGLSAGASAVPTRRQDWTCESLWSTQQPWGIKGEKWEVQIVFLGRNDDVVMVTGYFRIQNLKATSSKPFFFFSFLWVK